jgi:hypothetical protein
MLYKKLIKKVSKKYTKWQKACWCWVLPSKVKNTHKDKVLSKVIFFQKTFEYYDAINLNYWKHETQELQGHVLNANT